MRISFRNSIWREGESADFRFVEDEDALLPAALFEEAQKTLAVGMREEVSWGAGGNAGNIFEIDLVLVIRD